MTKLEGKCLCGEIAVTATPREREIGTCHCGVCRRWSAGPFMALSCGDDVEISGTALGVYRSSEWAERAFCRECGTLIAWRLQSGGEYHVSSQLFTESAEFPLGTQVFFDEKPQNYSFAEPTKTMTGAEVFALFAPSNDG